MKNKKFSIYRTSDKAIEEYKEFKISHDKVKELGLETYIENYYIIEIEDLYNFISKMEEPVIISIDSEKDFGEIEIYDYYRE